MLYVLAEGQGVELGSSYKITDSTKVFARLIAESQHHFFISPCPRQALHFSAT